MSNKNISDEKLIKQLAELPTEISAPNKWSMIKSSIESGVYDNENLDATADSEIIGSINSKVAENNWWPTAMAASLVMVFIVSAIWLNSQSYNDVLPDSNFVVSDTKFVKTIASLQQANNHYYSVLGKKMKLEQHSMDKAIQESLKDFRVAQKEYRMILEAQPDNFQLQEKLIDVYQKERKLLRKIIS